MTVEEALIHAARALTSKLDVGEVCDAILDSVERVFGARSCWLFLHEPDADVLRVMRYRGQGRERFEGVAIPADSGPVGRAFQDKRPLFIPDVRAVDGWSSPQLLEQSGVRAVFAIPLVLRGRGLGLLGMDPVRYTAETPPGDRDIAMLESFAAQAAVAVENARLYEESERERARLQALVDERERLQGQVRQLRAEVRTAVTAGTGRLIGNSPALREILNQADRVAGSDATVLIRGETGTGKELLARMIHDRSRRASAPFVAVNCPAIPDTLVERELFGHEKGSFTGATERSPGSFEAANGGTLLLDEIGDLPLEAQAKLLRTLQDGWIQRIGGAKPVRVDVRILAATNQDLEAAVAARQFRSDLYYRLNVFPITLPPLRQRREDIAPLFLHFVEYFAARMHNRVPSVGQGILDRLVEYDWPGNVRELQNVAERAVILSPGPVMASCSVIVGGPTCVLATDDPVSLAEAERRAIRRALDDAGWKISGPGGAARMLGLKPTTLHAKMRKLGVYRPGAVVPPAGGGRPQGVARPASG